MKYYIIQEIGFEYNDEIYSGNGNGDGKPVKIFKNKANAQKEVDKLNFDKFKTEPITQYTYDIEDIISDVDDFVEKLNEITGGKLTANDIRNNYDFTLPKMSQSNFEKIKSYINLSFYDVVECDGE